MDISIKFEGSWRNSFLDGDNNVPIPKGGRNYIASSQMLKKSAANFIEREVTLDTVMGVLNRLIGDQRKLYQSRSSQFAKSYFFKDVEEQKLVTFEEVDLEITGEVVYLRNMNGSVDPAASAGLVDTTGPLFTSDYSSELWGVLNLSVEGLYEFIATEGYPVPPFSAEKPCSPAFVCDFFERAGKLKSVELVGDVALAVQALAPYAAEAQFLDKKKNTVILARLYCSALYLQLDRIKKRFDVSSALTKAGNISGISKVTFTQKDFMKPLSSGGSKLTYGNPYKVFVFKEIVGKTQKMLSKARGTLKINLEVDREKAIEIKEMIEAAGVSSFYLGKKGLAYVDNIRV
jgi:hypothetical protein